MIRNKLNTKILLAGIGILLILAFFISPVTADYSLSKTTSYASFNEKEELVRPTGYREWIFIGAPLTPNDMNDGKAAFPEFHNVYIDPASWSHWKKTGGFADGTLIVKELADVGSKQAVSGNGYFQGEYIGLEAMVKSKKRFPDAPGYWGFFRFTMENSPNLHKSATTQANENCAVCHQSNAATDLVFTQYYPVLRAAKAQDEMGTGGK
jgi:cytochrome P460